ncbi:hypothetical protein EJ05DRAFT_528378 [Pseudovirgaria hyperparasitica]|uniref:Uncharacterized protein n=1 Tax=Pseudovirgaria hyperparasitica TaxID=470096 RepID=A0A6A6W4V0_9PEZI|nr:uncharacterized protein EJ05DRAFT_528378 [Pseudovirgaria hyperparasitica]KAF2757958.1 hypothetical protein EJ05DRAFT_528378 [Pseudovirgaria hyperparasitica]
MIRYFPTDQPWFTVNLTQVARTQPGACHEVQEREWRTYGPPPPNFWVAPMGSPDATQQRYFVYGDRSIQAVDEGLKENAQKPTNAVYTSKFEGREFSKGFSKFHPCSPEGRNSYPPPNFQEEMIFDVEDTPGFFHPPLKCWRAKATPEAVLERSEALLSDARYTGANSLCLSHPANRDTVIFSGEVEASCVARSCGFSLIIICCLTRAEGIGWQRIYDMENRPRIYSRWSTGPQATGTPLVLMCLPSTPLSHGGGKEMRNVFATGYAFRKRMTDWFTMKPTPRSSFEKILNTISHE